VWCVVLLLFGLLVQGTHASTYTFHATPGEFTPVELDVPDNRALVNYTQHELAKRELTPGWKAFSDAFSAYLAGKLSTPEFADNLVDEVTEAVCDNAAGQVITKALGVDLVEECVTAIYTANALTAPELEFLSVFGASILCNLLVSEALPGIDALTNAICNQPKPCSEDLLTDPNNCGSCGNVVSFYIFSPGALAIPLLHRGPLCDRTQLTSSPPSLVLHRHLRQRRLHQQQLHWPDVRDLWPVRARRHLRLCQHDQADGLLR
jgi:hypothetical protein